MLYTNSLEWMNGKFKISEIKSYHLMLSVVNLKIFVLSGKSMQTYLDGILVTRSIFR